MDHDDIQVRSLDGLAGRIREARDLAARSRAEAAEMTEPMHEAAAMARRLADDLDAFADRYEPELRRLQASSAVTWRSPT